MRQVGAVPVEVTNNGMDFTDSGVLFEYRRACDAGHYCSGAHAAPCPNGTMCPRAGLYNFTVRRRGVVRSCVSSLLPPPPFLSRPPSARNIYMYICMYGWIRLGCGELFAAVCGI